MGLFSRNKNTPEIQIANAINVNDVDTSHWCRPFRFRLDGKGKQDFASLFLYTILERISNGMRNVTFKTTEQNLLGDEINTFIDRNMELLLWHYYDKGYMCVMTGEHGIMRLPKPNELKFDANGQIVNKNAVVVYSNLYAIDRDSHTKVARPFLKNINTNLNNMDFITEQCGLYGILSGKSIPISPASKAELQEKLRKDYGTGDGQFNFIMSNAEITFTPINIPVKELEMTEKVNQDAKWICQIFQLNPDLLFGGSTFSNQSEAYRAFYRDCIIPLAERVLMLTRALFISLTTELKPSKVMTYDLSNVPEMDKTLSEKCEQLSSYLDYLLKLREAGQNVNDLIRNLAETAGKLKEV